jgi:hypothetical protein
MMSYDELPLALTLTTLVEWQSTLLVMTSNCDILERNGATSDARNNLRNRIDALFKSVSVRIASLSYKGDFFYSIGGEAKMQSYLLRTWSGCIHMLRLMYYRCNNPPLHLSFQLSV